jgi:hypothetical protein
VQAVTLHQVGMAPHAFEQKRNEGQLVLFRQTFVHALEFADVVGAVIRRERNAGQHHAGAGTLQRFDHLREVGFRDRRGDAA